MKLSNLSRSEYKKSRRLGQGHGSGRGKTSGRGTKGQNARSKRALSFEGGALPLIKRMPFRRGKGKNKVFRRKPIIVNIKVLNSFSPDTEISLQTLVKNHIIAEQDAKTYGVKVLGEGQLSVPLKVLLPVSKGARMKIEKSGGTVIEGNAR